ncbi:unnamed protein product [Adineta steineri]|uniref:Uncharacterized protein n=1 Tax=Adineta steineri TaxID=433720 RepID=A0A819B477_9BILA|nr:unnamed protein product [Adineta steineri]
MTSLDLVEKLLNTNYEYDGKYEPNQKDTSQEQININDKSVISLDKSSNPILSDEENILPSVTTGLKNDISQKVDNKAVLSNLIPPQIDSSILNLKENNFVQNHIGNEMNLEKEYGGGEEEEVIVVLDPNKPRKVTEKISLSNNIIRLVRGPFKFMIRGLMYAADTSAEVVGNSKTSMGAVQRGLNRQKENAIEHQTTYNPFKPPYTELTSDWKFDSENSDQGLSSVTVWIRDPQGRRILLKTEDHPLSAANEWLCYVLGRVVGLPVNEVQIAMYKDFLVTLHTDVAREDEKMTTFMDLPKQKREILLGEPIIACMDFFDRITQDADRNQQNILLTMPKTTDINDDNAKLRVHFVDHGACFGMAKLNGISVIGTKYQHNHLAVVAYDPKVKSKQFEEYLKQLPIADRPLIGKTLYRFASINNNQFDSWITGIVDLLTSSQYNRIITVLYQQRNIARRYVAKWGIYPEPSVKTIYNL